ncbi:MAG: glycerol-3-phosphate responsive antiterminator [Clostridiales bacterium]|nr:glycerol-3-phosphate responsive antiterminator [Clostridiales bacterium]
MKISNEKLNFVLEQNHFIYAIKDDNGLNNAINNDCKVVFVLYGTVINICDIVKALKDHNKIVFVHIDLIEGLSSKEVAVDYIANNTGADGIISTKQTLIKCASARGLLTVQRFFLIDSLALNNLIKQIKNSPLDYIEVLPACSTKTISKLIKLTNVPIIASGLIQDKEDILSALNVGAIAVSGSNFDLS